MTEHRPPRGLAWAQRLQAIAQTGLGYQPHQYDRERYEQIREIAAEMIAYQAEASVDVVRGLMTTGEGYATPKVDVRAAVFREGQLLYVREREDGCWTLPGGWADVGQSASESAVREVLEESGYQVRATKLLAVYERDRHPHPPIIYHSWKMFFRCEVVGGSPATSFETTDVRFFGEHEVPALSLPRVLPEQIRHLYDHERNPGWSTTFD